MSDSKYMYASLLAGLEALTEKLDSNFPSLDDSDDEIFDKEWNDNDTTTFYSHSFSTLPLDKSVKLAKMWWRLYTGVDNWAETSNITEIVACMALHLVDPTKPHAYIVDMAPPGIDLEPNLDIDAVLEAAGSKDDDSDAETGFMPFDSTPETEKEIAAANRWFSTLSPRNQVAFSALVATICLTTCTRRTDVVSEYIEKSVLIDFVKLYRRQPVTGVEIPAPDGFFMEIISDNFKSGSTLLQMVLSRFLTVYKVAKQSLTTKPIAGLLERLILNKTSGNGLKVVYLATDAAKVLHFETKDLLLVMHDDKYQTILDGQNVHDILKFIEITSANVLWPWCRVLNPRYHREVRMSEQYISALLFAGILWPNGDEPGWSIQVLQDKKEFLPLISKYIEHIRADLKKKCKPMKC